MKRNKSNKIKWGLLAIILFAGIYVPSLINWIRQDISETSLLKYGTMQSVIPAEALFVRDELLINAWTDGIFYRTVKEGDRVSKNMPLGYISDDKAITLKNRIENLEKKLTDSTNKKEVVSNVFSEDLKNLERQAGEKISALTQAVCMGSFSGTEAAKEDINDIIRKRSLIKGLYDSSDPYIKSILRNIALTKNELAGLNKGLASPYSGLLSYSIDGYESVLKPATIIKTSPSSFEQLLGKLSDKLVDVNSGQRVNKENKLMKLVLHQWYYIVMVLKEKEAEKLKTQGNIRVKVLSGSKFIDNAVLHGVYNSEGKKRLVIIKADRYSQDLAGIRKSPVEIVTATYEGLMVPVSSLRSIDALSSQAEIVLQKGSYTSARKVRILYMDNSFAIIEGVSGKQGENVNLYDTFLLKPGDIADNKPLD